MCGFGGIVNATAIDEQAVYQIARKVSHRGPDDTGTCVFDHNFQPAVHNGSHAFFFNRLAIIDLDPRSNQPFQDERHLLLFNGEIYNYKELKNELTRAGVIFHTTSDTEVLFQALNTWGKKALAKLNGMFAFFWLDKTTGDFMLARDRVGIKPLYYRIEGTSLIFASELNSVLRLSKDRPSISPQAVQQYLCLQYVPTPNTILEQIHKLAPGSCLSGQLENIGHKQITPIAFWDGYEYILSGNRPENTSLEHLLVDSVERQLEADVPLGLFLSSGVDSSLLTAIINKHFKRSYDFFTVSFDEQTASDESVQAAQFLRGFDNPLLKHHTLNVDPNFIASKIETLYNFYDEPFGDHAALLNWAISQKAREHVTVALSGDGADEMFWGYDRYTQWQSHLKRLYKNMPMLEGAQKMFETLPSSSIKYKLMNIAEGDPVSVHFNLLRPNLFGFLPSVESYDDLWCLQGLDKLQDRNDLASIIDLKTYLCDAMLYKVDRASMASSLEVRVPYLDNTIIDYALTLPLNQKSNKDHQNKAPLKNLLKSLAPHYDVNKPKRGFNFPLTQWLKNEWGAIIQDTITKSALESVGLESKPFLQIVDRFYTRNVPATNEIWYLFNLLLWYREFKKQSI